MPYWKPLELGKIIKRTKHKAWCLMCGDLLQKGDRVTRIEKHGVRLFCQDCNQGLEQAKELLKIYKERVR